MRPFVAAVPLLLAMALSEGCATQQGRFERVGEFTQRVDPGSARSLSVEGTVGSIELKSSDGTGIEVAVVALYRGGPQALGREAGPRDLVAKLDGDTIRIQSAHLDDATEGLWRLDLTISTPPDLDLRVRSQVGDCSIEGLRGALDVELGVGTLEVTTPGLKPVTVATCVGDVILRLPREYSGSLSLRAEVGGIQTTGTSALDVYRSVTYATAEGRLGDSPATVTARTQVGNIEVEVE